MIGAIFVVWWATLPGASGVAPAEPSLWPGSAWAQFYLPVLVVALALMCTLVGSLFLRYRVRAIRGQTQRV